MFIYISILNNKHINANKILELVLTINGLFSAILITYFFSNIAWTKSLKLERYKEAELISQKITNYRRILHKITEGYNVWNEDSKSKSLLEHNSNYKNITFYEFRMSGISDYEFANEENIQQLRSDLNYSDVHTDAYLAVVSLVHDRKNDRLSYFSNDLYGEFDRKGIYRLPFIADCIEIDHCSMIWNYFDRYDLVNFNRISSENKKYIKNCAKKIDRKYADSEVDAALIANVSDDMQEFYFLELQSILKKLKRGLNELEKLIYNFIIFSLFIGVIAPFTALIIDEFKYLDQLKSMIITANICTIIYFILNFKGMIEKEVKFI